MSYYYKRPYMNQGFYPNYGGYRNQQNMGYNTGYNKRPRYNQYPYERRQQQNAALSCSNLLFISGQPGEENSLLKNILSPSCTILARVGITSYNITFSIIRSNTKSSEGKLEFSVSSDALLSAKLVDISSESHAFVEEPDDSKPDKEQKPDEKDPKAEEKNVSEAEKAEAKSEKAAEKTSKVEEEAADAKKDSENAETEAKPLENGGSKGKKRNPYTQRLVLVLKSPVSMVQADEKVIEKESLEKARILVLEFKGSCANEKIDPKSVLSKSVKEGPLCSFQNEKIWLKDGEYTLDKVVGPFVRKSREYEGEMLKKTKCELCNKKLKKMHMDFHLSSVCDKRQVSCSHCKQEMVSESLQKHLNDDCVEVPISCPNGCVPGVKRSEQEEHLLKCPRRSVPCEFSAMGCEESVQAEMMEAHLRSEVHSHVRLLMARVAALEEKLGAKKE